jgi:RNA polymerase sigma-70 factor (sigma-E family)
VGTDGHARDAFVASQHPRLLRSARLLTGDAELAADLAQETLVRVLVKWPQVSRARDPQAYISALMLNVFLAGRRRRWNREVPHGQVPDRPWPRNEADAADDRDELRRRLLALPPKQRAAVVLRHYEQLSEADAAAALGCSTGTVKSLTSRGLASLRAAATELTGRKA